MSKSKVKRSLSVGDNQSPPLDDQTQIRSFDLGLAAALTSVGFSLLSLDRENLRKVQFIFRRSDGIDDAVEKYWDDRLEVRARTYFDALKMIKSRIYSE